MQNPKPVVLVVHREGDATQELIGFLRQNDLDVIWTRDGEGGFNVLDEHAIDCLVTELRAPRIDGAALLARARERNPEICAVMLAEPADVDVAVDAMRQGAHDYEIKPVHLPKLLAVLRRGISTQALAARVAKMEDRLDERLGIEQLTGGSRAIMRVMEQVRAIAETRATVLIEGETGTGKGVLAQAIHQNSPRKSEPFVWVNCGALSETALEAELFGQEGASGATSRRGRFEIADGGTLFLDAIGETPAAVQVKLLRVLQDRAFERVGGAETLKTDVRLIAATNEDLQAEVRAGRFRENLYYRLSVVRIPMPALRERTEDIPLLVESLIRKLNVEHGRKVTGVTRGALDCLMRYPWPGNVRELKNTLEGMMVFAEGKRSLDLSDLPERLRETKTGEPLKLAVGMTVEEAERQLIEATLRHTGQDKPKAAAMLGIGLRTLYRKIQEYSIR